MVVIQKIAEIKKRITEAKKEGKSIGFVPTMGYFHEGHLSLMRRAKAENDLVVVSLFVNPIQFGPNEDFQSYPRDLKRDQALCEQSGVDFLFIPEDGEMYPEGYRTFVEVTGISKGLCGEFRPGHFQGVATVVLKLFQITMADRAYFGQKDFQQLRVIQRMTTDLNLNVEVVGCPTVREADGLARSSRNHYLNLEERQAATVLYRILQQAETLLKAGWRETDALQKELAGLVNQEPLAQLEYLEILNSEDLHSLFRIEGNICVALAVKIGKTRLIDNLVYQVEEKLS